MPTVHSHQDILRDEETRVHAVHSQIKYALTNLKFSLWHLGSFDSYTKKRSEVENQRVKTSA